MGRAENEMVQGYFDGRDPDCPAPNENRSNSYRHGFRCGRDDMKKFPSGTARELREAAARAIAIDENI